MYPISTQRGAALIVFLLIALLGGSSFLLSKLLNSSNLFSSQYFQKQLQTEKNLAQAKAALLGYAVNYHERFPGMYGFLPCPDYSDDGEEGQEDDCSLKGQDVSVLGKLPWKTLGLPVLRDDGYECLWYAVSGYHKDISYGLSYQLADAAPPPLGSLDLYKRELARTNMLNSDTPGLFEIYHIEPGTGKPAILEANHVVAVIIAPGKPLTGQNRTSADPASTCGKLYDQTQYLDDPGGGFSNQDFSNGIKTINQFFTANSAYQDQINDRLTYITRDELFQAIRKRSDFISTIQDFTRIVTLAILKLVNEKRADTGEYEQRLPWPSFYSDARDYDTDDEYNDFTDNELNAGAASISNPRPLSGRIPNIAEVPREEVWWPVPGSVTSPTQIFLPPSTNIVSDPWPLTIQSFVLDNMPIISAYGFYSDLLTDLMTMDITSTKLSTLASSAQLYRDWRVEEFLAMWRNWKDHFFYVVSEQHRPDGAGTIATCTIDTCVRFEQTITPAEKTAMTPEEQVTVMPEEYAAAIVIFAGERLPEQYRETRADKADISNYLEGINAESFKQGDGKGLYAQYGRGQWNSLLDDYVEGEFSCEPKKTCGDIATCREVKFQLEKCGNEALLADEGQYGVPCPNVCQTVVSNDILYCIFIDKDNSDLFSVNYCKY
jgi:hypothetical protein